MNYVYITLYAIFLFGAIALLTNGIGKRLERSIGYTGRRRNLFWVALCGSVSYIWTIVEMVKS